MELRLIGENKTQLKASFKSYGQLIEQLKFIGAKVIKESSIYCYFEFNGDVAKTREMLGL
ncbi:hypothetical protein N2W52_001994 [Clostridium perfringens]|nr:hypothetical protein [Clostridium perfringens]MDK0983011.1 hypothetical protein [Clostridium perfringens]